MNIPSIRNEVKFYVKTINPYMSRPMLVKSFDDNIKVMVEWIYSVFKYRKIHLRPEYQFNKVMNCYFN